MSEYRVPPPESFSERAKLTHRSLGRRIASIMLPLINEQGITTGLFLKDPNKRFSNPEVGLYVFMDEQTIEDEDATDAEAALAAGMQLPFVAFDVEFYGVPNLLIQPVSPEGLPGIFIGKGGDVYLTSTTYIFNGKGQGIRVVRLSNQTLGGVMSPDESLNRAGFTTPELRARITVLPDFSFDQAWEVISIEEIDQGAYEMIGNYLGLIEDGTYKSLLPKEINDTSPNVDETTQ